jgi:hypothetical protein
MKRFREKKEKAASRSDSIRRLFSLESGYRVSGNGCRVTEKTGLEISGQLLFDPSPGT